MSTTLPLPAPVAAFDGVTVRYGRNVAADTVSFAVPPGQVYALLGRNGAGKSSLVRCLLGQQKPTAGTARLFGADVWRTRVAAMARIGFVPEEADVPPEMSARDAAAFCAPLYPRWDATAFAERLDRSGVPDRAPAGQLSKGQRKQLALALALAPSPELLVLDDPTLGLDAIARRELWEELVGDLADRGTTVLLTTHDLAGVEGIAERVGILAAGRLVVDEDLEALKSRFRRVRLASLPDTHSLVESAAMLGVGRVVGGEFGIEMVVERWSDDGAAAFARAAGIADLEVTAMTLEEIFTAVAGPGDGGAR
jgi:ABC-2 type transport system ATP-binding protein